MAINYICVSISLRLSIRININFMFITARCLNLYVILFLLLVKNACYSVNLCMCVSSINFISRLCQQKAVVSCVRVKLLDHPFLRRKFGMHWS